MTYTRNQLIFTIFATGGFFILTDLVSNMSENNKMIAETTDKLRKRHTGRNVQRVRMYFGVKQEALAADLGISTNVYYRAKKKKLTY